MEKEFGASKELRKSFMTIGTLMTIIGILFLARGIYLISVRSNPTTGMSFIFLAGLFLLSIWLTAETFKTTRLVLSPERLEFYSPGLVLTTSWDNLERIGSVSTLLGSAKSDNLVLRAAAIQKTAWWFKLLRKHPEHVIPMSMFSNWRGSEIGQEIKRYAPHLFLGSTSSK
jgi:hypothetical protein